jgi:redox-sensitive bicupin YhaK (pirin superfamily)
MEHRDSYGNHGRLGPGDVQWMTAGSGLIHSEMPGPDIVRNGGRLEGFQLWVNLPKRDKMMPPRYQELKAESIPVAQDRGIAVRVIAGEALGRKGLIQTHLPITYLHLFVQAGAEFAHSVAAQQNVFAYVIRGEAAFDSRAAGEGSVVVFANDGDEIRVKALKDSEALLIAGQPIGEPVARYGPFVMNTRQEIVQAFDDFQQGRMGRL